MLHLIKHKQKTSDKFGVFLIRRASKINNVREHGVVDFKWLYTSKLSDNYRYPKHIVREDLNLDGLVVESIYHRGSEPKYAMIHLHGGGYVMDYNDTYRYVARKYLSLNNNMKVFSPIYSLAPRHPFPAALDEVVRLYIHILESGFSPEQIVFAGDSAGGGLSIATALFLRDNGFPLPKAIIAMSPWTNLAMDGESHTRNKYVDPLFGEGAKPLNVKAYVRRHDIRDPYISPKYADYSSFTNMLMFVGGDELIESDTLDVAAAAQDNNEVIVHDFEGMFHVFPLAFNKMHSSRVAWKIIEQYLNETLRG